MFIRLFVFVNISLPGNFIWSFVNFLLLIPMTLSFKKGTTHTHTILQLITLLSLQQELFCWSWLGMKSPPHCHSYHHITYPHTHHHSSSFSQGKVMIKPPKSHSETFQGNHLQRHSWKEVAFQTVCCNKRTIFN